MTDKAPLDFFDIEFLRNGIVKKATCRPCRISFNFHGSEREENEREAKAMKLHLEMVHGVTVGIVKCSDPKCLKDHRS